MAIQFCRKHIKDLENKYLNLNKLQLEITS